MANAQPIVDRLAELICVDLDGLSDVFIAANQNLITNTKNQNSTLTANRRDLQEAMKQISVDTLEDKDQLDHFSKISTLLAENQIGYSKYVEAINTINARKKAGSQLIASTKAAVKTWALTHAQLQAAVREKQTINVEALTRAATDLTELIKRMQAL